MYPNSFYRSLRSSRAPSPPGRKAGRRGRGSPRVTLNAKHPRVSLWKKVSRTITSTAVFKVHRENATNLAKERWKKLRLALKMGRGISTYVKERQEVIEHLDESGATETSDIRDQGNVDMYSLDAMLARDKLREHPAIVGAINQLWGLMKPGDDSHGLRMSRGEYQIIYKRILTVVCPELTPAQQQETIDADWDRDRLEDNVLQETLSYARFFNSMFELADIWCEGITWQEYFDFLKVVVVHVSRHGRLLRIDSVSSPFGTNSGFWDIAEDSALLEETGSVVYEGDFDSSDEDEDEVATPRPGAGASPLRKVVRGAGGSSSEEDEAEDAPVQRLYRSNSGRGLVRSWGRSEEQRKKRELRRRAAAQAAAKKGGVNRRWGTPSEASLSGSAGGDSAAGRLARMNTMKADTYARLLYGPGQDKAKARSPQAGAEFEKKQRDKQREAALARFKHHHPEHGKAKADPFKQLRRRWAKADPHLLRAAEGGTGWEDLLVVTAPGPRSAYFMDEFHAPELTKELQRTEKQRRPATAKAASVGDRRKSDASLAAQRRPVSAGVVRSGKGSRRGSSHTSLRSSSPAQRYAAMAAAIEAAREEVGAEAARVDVPESHSPPLLRDDLPGSASPATAAAAHGGEQVASASPAAAGGEAGEAGELGGGEAVVQQQLRAGEEAGVTVDDLPPTLSPASPPSPAAVPPLASPASRLRVISPHVRPSPLRTVTHRSEMSSGSPGPSQGYLSSRRGGIDLGMLGCYALTDPDLAQYSPQWLSSATPITPRVQHGEAKLGLGGSYSAAELRMPWSPPVVSVKSKRRKQGQHPTVKVRPHTKAPPHARFFKKQRQVQLLVSPAVQMTSRDVLLRASRATSAASSAAPSRQGSARGVKGKGGLRRVHSASSVGRGRKAALAAASASARPAGLPMSPMSSAGLEAGCLFDKLLAMTPAHAASAPSLLAQRNLVAVNATQGLRTFEGASVVKPQRPASTPPVHEFNHVMAAYAATAAAAGGVAGGWQPHQVQVAAAVAASAAPSSSSAGGAKSSRAPAAARRPPTPGSARGSRSVNPQSYFQGAWNASTYQR